MVCSKFIDSLKIRKKLIADFFMGTKATLKSLVGYNENSLVSLEQLFAFIYGILVMHVNCSGVLNFKITE